VTARALELLDASTLLELVEDLCAAGGVDLEMDVGGNVPESRFARRAPVACSVTSPAGAKNLSVTTLEWTLVGVGVTVAIYLAFVLALFLAGRRSDARAFAAFIPDCIVLFRRLLGDPRVSGWRKATIIVLIAYLAMPIDLVPDFIPVAGQLDDAIVVALVLRTALRSGGPELLREHWPGPDASLAVISRLACGEGEWS
jgi:uncharacterized membrane protein YkvA (DUF1232 family)